MTKNTYIITGGLKQTPILVNEDGKKRTTIADGFAVNMPSGGGVWASVEASDVFAAAGYAGFPGVWGSLDTTEAQDIFAGVGHIPSLGTMAITEQRDQFSAYGYMPVKGTLTVTERPDIFAAVGFGAGGVNGAWAST